MSKYNRNKNYIFLMGFLIYVYKDNYNISG